MAQTDMKKLDSRDIFPDMDFQTAAGATATFPETAGGNWWVLLVYRGVW